MFKVGTPGQWGAGRIGPCTCGENPCVERCGGPHVPMLASVWLAQAVCRGSSQGRRQGLGLCPVELGWSEAGHQWSVATTSLGAYTHCNMRLLSMGAGGREGTPPPRSLSPRQPTSHVGTHTDMPCIGSHMVVPGKVRCPFISSIPCVQISVDTSPQIP